LTARISKARSKPFLKRRGEVILSGNIYDFKGLLDRVLQGSKIDEIVFYFAQLKENSQTREKSKELINEQRLLKTHLEKQGCRVVLAGRVRGQFEEGSGGKKILVFKEKGVDVRIAVDMVSGSCDKTIREVVLGSSDSDLQPAIKEVRERGSVVVYLGFESQPNKGISYTSNRTILIRNAEVLAFETKPTLFSDTDGDIISTERLS
jgi:uncharacterized LabA/DUF88 family protein